MNALVRDLDLGVDIADLTFGKVDPAKAEELFNQLNFGARIRSKLLKTFNAGDPGQPVAKKASDAERFEFEGEFDDGSFDTPESVRVQEPVVDEIDAPASLEAWAQQHCPIASGKSISSTTLDVVGEYDAMRRSRGRFLESVRIGKPQAGTILDLGTGVDGRRSCGGGRPA